MDADFGETTENSAESARAEAPAATDGELDSELNGIDDPDSPTAAGVVHDLFGQLSALIDRFQETNAVLPMEAEPLDLIPVTPDGSVPAAGILNGSVPALTATNGKLHPSNGVGLNGSLTIGSVARVSMTDGTVSHAALPSDRTDAELVASGPTKKHYDSPGRSAVGHIRLVAAIMVIGALIGAAFAMLRPPSYTAEARLYVGKTMNLTNTASIAGLANAGSQMASAYSRLISTSTVLTEVERRVGHPGHLGGSLSASPVPQSPVIRIDASSSTSQGAVDLAQAGAAALIDAVNQINQLSQSQVTQLEQAYANDESTIENLTNTLSKLQAQLASTPPASQGALQAQITATNTKIKVAQLQADADSSQFQAQVSSIQGEEQVVTQEGSAIPTGSDRKTYLEIAVLGGIIGGLIVSIALASLIDLRRDKAAAGTPAIA